MFVVKVHDFGLSRDVVVSSRVPYGKKCVLLYWMYMQLELETGFLDTLLGFHRNYEKDFSICFFV